LLACSQRDAGHVTSLLESVEWAADVAAFNTSTGMPYGTVNLVSGIPACETTVTCTAGVGTFILEFGSLTQLTGDPVFMNVAVQALKALWQTRSPLGLVSILDIHPDSSSESK